MPTPASGDIAFSQVRDELGQSNPAEMSNFYDTANTGGISGLMYHNLNMDIGNATTAKVAIWDPYNAGINQPLSNWYNYYQDIGLVMEFDINNTSIYDIAVNVAIRDSSGINRGTIFNGTVVASGSTGAMINTGLLSVSGGVSSGYAIWIDNLGYGGAPLPPSPPNPIQNFNVNATINSASDIDGVGAGTNRTTYGPWSQNVTNTFPPPPGFTPQTAVDDGGSMIPVNKRTYIDITLS
jgi:hypothetical protein